MAKPWWYMLGPMIAGVGVLGVDDAPEGLADVVAVDAEVGVLARGEEGEQGQAGHARPLLAPGGPGSIGLRGVLEPLLMRRPRLAAVPGPVPGLRRGEELQAPVVDLADVARTTRRVGPPAAGRRPTRRANGERRQGETIAAIEVPESLTDRLPPCSDAQIGPVGYSPPILLASTIDIKKT